MTGPESNRINSHTLQIRVTRTVGGVSLWLARQHAGRKKKNARGLAGLQLEKREVGKPCIESIQKLSDHAVDWFLVLPGLTLRV